MLDEFIGQVLADKYRIDSVVRESGLGKIYRGTHLLMDKLVTVKILSPALAIDENIVKRFSAEARTVSHISHPNILNVTDFGSDKNGAVFIVLEDATGETLKDVIRHEGKFSQSRAVRVARQIAAALSAAHAAAVVHHHLSSANVLLAHTTDEAELVKVLDFGSVRENNGFDEETDLEDLEYLSPEQNSSVQETDERADIYGLGVIFYEMLAGEVPFKAETPTALMLKQAEEPPVPLSAFRNDLPEYIEPIVLKALAKNPEMRYQSAAEFADDLINAPKNVDETETIVIPADITDNKRNNLWKTAFVVLAGISLLAIGLIYATSVKQTNPTTQLQSDANGQPVQPLNPATGLNEQGLSNMLTSMPEMMGNSNMTMPLSPNALPGGDGYDPWARGGVPPPGAPYPVAPGGQVYTIPGDANGSQFMPGLDGYVLVPQITNTNTNTTNPKPAPTPKGTPAPVNTQPTPTPKENTPPQTDTKPTPAPKPAKTPAKPAETQKPSPPASTEKRAQSGKEQDSQRQK
ncbi:MAG: protein kinase [Acidobacteriota bacterium]|nr:protein kinase [Acidobacteriota bacterium]